MNNLKLLIENEFEVNFDKLNSLLLKYQGVIAGGSVLMSYINEIENYNGDIDIFIRASNVNIYEIIKDFIIILDNYKVHLNTNYTVPRKGIDFDELFASKINSIFSFTNNKKEIQIIFINVSTNSYIETFDLSFCTTTWDGYKIECLYPELTLNKKGFFINSIDNKTRRKKYEARGFQIENID